VARSSTSGVGRLRAAFAGTPDFALPCLRALVAGGAEIAAVFTQPDRRAGRGRTLRISPVKRLAQEYGLPVRQPLSLRDQGPVVAALNLDVLVVVAYGLLIPPTVLTAPRFGCINVHASLLPRWRGAAPIVRALESGDAVTGVTIMSMDAGLDTGPILAVRREPIHAEDTAATLHDRLAGLGAAALLVSLPKWVAGTLAGTAQDARMVTYAAKVTPSEARIQWSDAAVVIERRVRAFNPWPVAHFYHRGNRIRVWRAGLIDAVSAGGVPGEVRAADRAGILVRCGPGALRITELQRDGGKRLGVGEFLNGYPITPGERFQ